MAIVFALNRFHSYLWSNPFTLFTDHRALTFLYTQPTLNAMMTTWMDTLLSYTFTPIHSPGILNILPDHLSQIFPSSFQEGIIVGKATISNKVHIDMDIIPQVNMSSLETPDIDKKPTLLHQKHLLGHFGAEAIVQALHDDSIY